MEVQLCSQRHIHDGCSALTRVCLHAVAKTPVGEWVVLRFVTGDERVRNQQRPVREIRLVHHEEKLQVPGRVDTVRGAQVGAALLEARADKGVPCRREQVGRDGRGVPCGGQFFPPRVKRPARGRRVGVAQIWLLDRVDLKNSIGGLVGEDTVEVL